MKIGDKVRLTESGKQYVRDTGIYRSVGEDEIGIIEKIDTRPITENGPLFFVKFPNSDRVGMFRRRLEVVE